MSFIEDLETNIKNYIIISRFVEFLLLRHAKLNNLIAQTEMFKIKI